MPPNQVKSASNKAHSPFRNCHRGFTLIELLVVIGIIAILASLLVASIPGFVQRGKMAQSLSNLRQIGVAFQSYANDNDFFLPSRVKTGDKWPRLLNQYLGDSERNKIYADPADEGNFLAKKKNPLSNDRNNTSYIMNGYNDLGTLDDETVKVKSLSLDQPSKTLLAAAQRHSGHFYMDSREGDSDSVLNKTLYGKGSTYLFADGSARFLAAEDYDSDLWLVSKDPPAPQP